MCRSCALSEPCNYHVFLSVATLRVWILWGGLFARWEALVLLLLQLFLDLALAGSQFPNWTIPVSNIISNIWNILHLSAFKQLCSWEITSIKPLDSRLIAIILARFSLQSTHVLNTLYTLNTRVVCGETSTKNKKWQDRLIARAHILCSNSYP